RLGCRRAPRRGASRSQARARSPAFPCSGRGRRARRCAGRAPGECRGRCPPTKATARMRVEVPICGTNAFRNRLHPTRLERKRAGARSYGGRAGQRALEHEEGACRGTLALVAFARQRCAVQSQAIVDAHVHLHPERLAEAIRRWFDTHAWHIKYRAGVDEAVRTLREGGVARMVALPYVHKPGLARALNDFTLDVARRNPEVLPSCTVF